MKKSNASKKTYQLGIWSEFFAKLYLRLKGYKCIHSRWRSPFGEIDLILKKRNFFIFVEVKYRTEKEHLDWAVSPKQYHRIQKSIDYFLQNHKDLPHDFTCRFDVIYFSRLFRPKHIKNIQL